MTSAYLCSRDDRVTRLDWDGQSWAARPVLDGVSASCVATDGERVLVGTQGDGARLSSDGGGSWEPIDLPERDVLSVAISGADGALYAGTEPSRLFVSRDGGAWTELEALQEIPSKDQWSFPPRPWTHHVRWIAPDPHVPSACSSGSSSAASCTARTPAGASPTTGPGQSAMRTASPGTRPRRGAPIRPLVTARPGAATAASAGRPWTPDVTFATAGLWRSIRPILTAGTYRPPRARGRRTRARTPPGGSTSGRTARWRALDLPGDSMPYALAAIDEALLAAMADGRILHSGDRGETWEETGVRIGSVLAMAATGE